jgi:hemerythrin
MSTLEWSKSLELGVEKMDATHREFIDLLNAYGGPDGDFSRCSTSSLHTRWNTSSRKSFDDTDRFRRSLSYRRYDGVLEAMRETRQYVQDGRVDVGRVLARELAPWFASHAATMDAMLAHALKANGVDPDHAPARRPSLLTLRGLT